VLSEDYADLLRDGWWAAVATLTQMFGDLEAAEDAVQDACLLAVATWPATGAPANPGSWLVGTARHKALDRLRREGRRAEKEAEATRGLPGQPESGQPEADPPDPGGADGFGDDELGP
jgi:RNA polymerase sigma-70 factor (ECF subfamily)